MLCADVVEALWQDSDGNQQRVIALLEDISRSGACLQLDGPVSPGTPVRVVCNQLELVGRVRYCVFREIGYFTGLEFDPGSQWSTRQFRPRHLLDVTKMVFREGNHREG
jgi:hypothetical protein